MLQDKQQFLDNWNQFELNDALCESLVANNFNNPTKVQGQSLVYLQSHIDLIIAAKTGQGKTLCFGLPILDILVKKVQKFNAAQDSSSSEEENKSENSAEESKPKPKKQVFDSVKALIISPTRELAIQIRDMIDAVIPVDYQEQIKTCAIVGGMSIQKQQRLLSYKPAIVIATPGRLWELMDDVADPYLSLGLPMIDVLVLDEADRMIADGHFRELKDILNHIYKKRVDFKREALQKNKQNKGQRQSEFGKVGSQVMKEAILKDQKEAVGGDSKDFRIGTNLQVGGKSIGNAKIVDLDEEDEDIEELMIDDDNEQVVNPEDHLTNADKHKQTKERKQRLAQIKKQEEEDDEQFDKDYLKYGGIQHIVCSATMTIDNTGRITPKQDKKNKKQGIDVTEQRSTLDALCETLKFRSKHPKVIDLTIEEGASSLPDTLSEYLVRCKSEEKDLYLYYFLQEKKGESVIIFSNAITATRRLNSLLDFLKIKNFCLHSQMQQKQRLKNLDRFKRAVNDIESGTDNVSGAILVCTDVAARGLDIPFVSNVVHYQCPYNAEIYTHRCGRTARIGRNGDALNLLTPDDNKYFKQICLSLKKHEDQLLRYEVKYGVLDKIKPLIDQAKKLEKTIHKKQSNEKEANWTLNLARDAELPLDEDMQHDLAEQLGSKNAAKSADVLDDEKIHNKYQEDTPQKKRENKARQKEKALKTKYDAEIESQKMKKFSNSSYLTPEAAVYLNEVMQSGGTQADEEVIYAGLHQQTKNKMKFKRRETYSSKYTKRRQGTRKRKGRFG